MLIVASSLVLARPAIAQSLADRYAAYRCAIVRIETTEGVGTGFFIDAGGTLVTAAHVVYTRTFDKSGTVVTSHVKPISTLTVQIASGEIRKIQIGSLTESDIQDSFNDIVRIKTGIKPPCFLHQGSALSQKVGTHVLAIGFPTGATTPVLYDGFISGLALSSKIPIGAITSTGETVNKTLNLLRVQMPITRGVSGSPLITDDGKVIGVVSEIPLYWTQELTRLMQTYGANKASSAIRLNGFDITKILADLALAVSEFESPGAALVVPEDYLK